MKILKTILATSILVMVVASCGNNTSVAVETTVTTIDYGDCSEAADTVWESHWKLIDDAYILDGKSWNLNQQTAWGNYRQFIRRLNIPFMQLQQSAYVLSITQYIEAQNNYWAYSTNPYWTQLNLSWTTMEDAYNDFRDTWNPLCDDDYPYPADLFTTDPTASDSSYDGYNDSYDQDCADIRHKVWVGSYDPDNLDADGDGWGCESYGL